MPIRDLFRGSRANRDRRDQSAATEIIARATEMHNEAVAAFHSHLEICSQCADQPFNLCTFGEALFLKTGLRARKS